MVLPSSFVSSTEVLCAALSMDEPELLRHKGSVGVLSHFPGSAESCPTQQGEAAERVEGNS